MPHRGPRRKPRSRRLHLLEPIEPRILLSADLSYVAMGDADLTLRVSGEGGSEILQLVDTMDPRLVLASESLSAIDGSAGFGARIDANGHSVRLTLDSSVQEGRVAGGILFDGSGEGSLRGTDGGV